jgi:hypothetical protein
VNFNYNPAIGLMGGYDYTEQLYMSGVLVGGSVKQTAIVNPPQDLGNGCPTQDLDLVVTFNVETIAPTPTVTNTQTPTTTPTTTPTPTNTGTSTATPTPTPTITPTSSPSGLDPDAVNYLNAIITTGGTLNATISAATNTLFVDLKANGLYSKIDAMYPFIGGTQNSSIFNAKNPINSNAAFRLNPVITGLGIFTYSNASGIYIPDGSYCETFYNPTAETTAADQHISVYTLTDIPAAIGFMGSFDGNEVAIYPNFLSTTNFYPVVRANGQPYSFASQPTQPGIGYFIATTDGTNVIGSKNGTNVVNGAQAAGITNIQHYIGNCNGNTGGGQSGNAIFATIGKALTTGEMTTLSNIVNAFQTALGRNTY